LKNLNFPGLKRFRIAPVGFHCSRLLRRLIVEYLLHADICALGLFIFSFFSY